MTRTFIGHKSGVGGVVKIMADSADDPLTTPNTDYAKFLFNSETGKLGYVFETYTKVADGTRNANRQPTPTYLIEGASFATAKQVLAVYDTSSSSTGQEYHMINLTQKHGFTLPPIFEVRTKTSAGRFTKAYTTFSEQSGYDSGDFYYYGFLNYDHCGGIVQELQEYTIGAYDIQHGYLFPAYRRLNQENQTLAETNTGRPGNKIGATGDRWGIFDIGYNFTGTAICSIWDLPGDSTALEAPATYSAGQKMVSISQTEVKVAMPGYDVATATRRQKIIDSDRVPAKIIACGEVFVAASGNTTVSTPTGFPLTGNIYVDYIAWENSSPVYIPFYKQVTSGWNTAQLSIEYEIGTNSVTFYNPRTTGLNVRYMVMADDDAAPSTGSGKVIETKPDFTRILKPGADDTNPAWSDILLDSRLPYVPILAEGYEAVSGFVTNSTNVAFLGNKKKTVSFSNGGLTPFPKVYVKHSNGLWTSPIVRLSVSNENVGQNVKVLKQSAFCALTSTDITFHCNPSGLADFQFSTTSHGWVSFTDGTTPVGFRYYIFGLDI